MRKYLRLFPHYYVVKSYNSDKNLGLNHIFLHLICKDKVTHSFCPISVLLPDMSEPRERPVGDCLPVKPEDDMLEESDSP